MSELTKTILEAIAAKKAAAGGKAAGAEKDEAEFKETFAALIEALTELKAVRVANDSGPLDWKLARRLDGQQRYDRFEGLRVWFGGWPSESYKMPNNHWSIYPREKRWAVAHTYYGSDDAVYKLAKEGKATWQGDSTHEVPREYVAEIIESAIAWITYHADR